MMNKLMQHLLLFFVMIIGLIIMPLAVRADYTLTELRIAATIALEAGGSGARNRNPMENVAKVIQERHKSNSRVTWSEVLYGGKSWFESSRGFASKNEEELMKYIKNKAGSNWQYALQLAQKTVTHGHARLMSGGKVANGFMRNYQGTYGPKLFTDEIGHDFFNTQLGDQHVAAFCAQWSKGKCVRKIDMKGLDDNTPRQSNDWDNAVVDKNINGATGNYSSGGDGGGSSGGSSGGTRSAAKHKPSRGHQNAEMCSMDNIRQSYGDSNSCWYCDVVIILTNSFLNAAGKALPSAIALGQIILKLGFLIWLAYYILQQVSSFAPVTPSKMLQDILVMGFKVALASVVVDAANAVIIEYFINPIGELGTDYGLALYDKLLPAS